MANEESCIPLNFTEDNEGAYLAYYNPIREIVTYYLISVILVIGLFGNFVFIFTIYRVPRLRKKTVNYYLIILAIMDSCFLFGAVLFFIYPLIVSQTIGNNPVPFGQCWTLWSILFLTQRISVGLVTVIAIERYIAVCRPLQYRSFSSKKRAKQLIGIVFLVAIVSSILTTPTFSKHITYCITWPDTAEYENFPTPIEACVALEWVFPFMFVLFYDLPVYIVLILNFILYWKIINCLSKETLVSVKNRGKDQVRNQVSRMLVVNGCIFFVCQSPALLFDMGDSLKAVGHAWITGSQEQIFLLVIQITLSLNSAVNPYIYNIFSSHYRQAMREAFQCCFAEKEVFHIQPDVPDGSGGGSGPESADKTKSTNTSNMSSDKSISHNLSSGASTSSV